jgi:hypothetical protein
MRENPYKRLPPIERKQDSSLYRMTPAQRKQANALIRRECCCCEDGNCIVLDDGDTCTCAARVHRRQKTESERKRRSTVDS